MSRPAIAVAISSRGRPLRLRWLLNALAEQTLATAGFEVIVAHEAGAAETESVLESHPLRSLGVLRSVAVPARLLPGAGRNAAWRAARAPLIAFTDDDCRPDPEWLHRAGAAAGSRPGAIIQGQTLPDPDESAVLLGAPWVQTMKIAPPTPWTETCNVVYPKDLLERLGGFDGQLRVGEDAELACRARQAGASIVAAPELLVYHAVAELALPAMIASKLRWRDLARVVQRHPELRRRLYGRIWWKPEHAALMLALTGLTLGSRWRPAAVTGVPWVVLAMRHRGSGPRGLARSLTELPGRAAIDAAEIVALARGSVRYRTLLL